MTQFSFQQQNESSFVMSKNRNSSSSLKSTCRQNELQGEAALRMQQNSVHSQIMKNFRVPHQRLDPCLKSPKGPVRRFRSLRSIPNIEPVTPKKVTLEGDEGIVIINGKQQPSIIPKLDLRRLTTRTTSTPRLPIARRTILEKNDEVFQALIRQKSSHLGNVRKGNLGQCASDVCEAASTGSTPSSVSSFEVPVDCPPTPRGRSFDGKKASPFQGQQKLQKCPTFSPQDRGSVSKVIEEINLMRTQSLDNTRSFISRLKAISIQFQSQELE